MGTVASKADVTHESLTLLTTLFPKSSTTADVALIYSDPSTQLLFIYDDWYLLGLISTNPISRSLTGVRTVDFTT